MADLRIYWKDQENQKNREDRVNLTNHAESYSAFSQVESSLHVLPQHPVHISVAVNLL